MKIATNYEAIKDRAIVLLTAPNGFNGYTAAEIMTMPITRWGLRNDIGVALCQARREIEEYSASDVRLNIGNARNVVRFNIGNFEKAEREIARYMKERHRATPSSSGPSQDAGPKADQW